MQVCSFARWCLVLLLVFAAACRSTTPPPDALGVEPVSGVRGVATAVTISGNAFTAKVLLDFDRPSQSVVDRTFRVRVGDVEATGVEWQGEHALAAIVPGELEVGAYDVTVIDPRGASDVIAGGFTVVPPPGTLKVESQPGGAGTEVGDLTVVNGSMTRFYAVVRDVDGGFLGDVNDAVWSVEGGIGTLVALDGGVAELTATALGTGAVSATHAAWGTDATGVITVTACSMAGDCVDACHAAAQCVMSACVPGAADLDGDGDTFVSAMCTGGTDCDDGDDMVNPAGVEEGYATALCTDGKDNDCDGLADLDDPNCAPNSAPLAVAVVTPPVGAPGDTFTGDATGSTDRETPAQLTYAWDWDGDGVFEAPGATTQQVLTTAGLHPVAVQVTDPQGLSTVASFVVVVADAAETATVTTGVDESNAGATPANPQGAGFSLREALAWSDARAGGQTVILPPGTTVALTGQLNVTDTEGVTLVGDGAVIDGMGITGAGASCLDFAGANHLLLGVAVTNCRGWPVYMHANTSQASRCRVYGNGFGVEWAGTDNVFGPDNEAYGNAGFGVEVNGRAQVVGNLVHGNTDTGIAVRAGGDDSVLVGNVVRDNGVGVRLLTQADGAKVRFNTVHHNAGAGVEVANATAGHELLNNVLSDNGGWGIDVQTGSFALRDGNDFFGNALGRCRTCAGFGASTVFVDPMYVDEAGNDLRIDLLSPLVDAAVPTSDDRTPGEPGAYRGAGPDIGAYEAR